MRDSDLRAYFTVLYNQGRRIERLLRNEGHYLMELNDELTAVKGELDSEGTKLDGLITAFKNAGELTPAQAAAFSAIESEITGQTAEIDDANPTVSTEPTPVDTTPVVTSPDVPASE